MREPVYRRPPSLLGGLVRYIFGPTREEGAPREREPAGMPRVRRGILGAPDSTEGHRSRGGRGTVPQLRFLSPRALLLRSRRPDGEPAGEGRGRLIVGALRVEP